MTPDDLKTAARGIEQHMRAARRAFDEAYQIIDGAAQLEGQHARADIARLDPGDDRVLDAYKRAMVLVSDAYRELAPAMADGIIALIAGSHTLTAALAPTERAH